MAPRYFPVRVGSKILEATCYWAKAPGYSEAALLKTWNGYEGARQQDAAELARLAAMKWEATCELGTVASTLDEIQAAIRADPKAEVTVMLLAEARWFDEQLLGVALFHRTWAGNVFLDFLAAHPATAGRVGGIGVGLLYQVCDTSRKLGAPLLWGETAANSVEFYERVLDLEAVSDQLLVPLDRQTLFCERVEAKWHAGH